MCFSANLQFSQIVFAGIQAIGHFPVFLEEFAAATFVRSRIHKLLTAALDCWLQFCQTMQVPRPSELDPPFPCPVTSPPPRTHRLILGSKYWVQI